MHSSKDRTKHVRAFFRQAQQPQPTKSETMIPHSKDSEVLEAVHRATESFKLCPNRLWAVTRNLPGGLENIPWLFPPSQKVGLFPQTRTNHDQCSFEFCELSQLDFTSVDQRHECDSNSYGCEQLKQHFPSQVLNEAAELGQCTAWKFNGQSLVKQPNGYMAISHVWSDGTGTGAGSEKGLNRCLWHFFIQVAKTLQISGIWWDTISIPRDKAARAKAISRMHRNYEDARVTLVHDCFLREIEWDDSDPRAAAEDASLAIIMSPWFGRGWTALELAKSSKVKIIFRKGNRYILKDLDNDILSASTNQTPAYHIATQAIQNLRRGTITSIDDLLAVLGPRSTSWSRDLAVIAALLTGIEFASTDSQQELYQNILRKIGKVCHRHLFQNYATMSKGFNWCPAKILNMPFASGPASLLVEDNGNLVGTWKVFQIGSISKRRLAWIGVPPLSVVALRSALENPNQHVFMVEPDGEDVSGALVVKVLGRHRMFQRLCGRLVGFLPFHPAQNIQTKTSINLEVSLGDTNMAEQSEAQVWGTVKSCRPDFTGNSMHIKESQSLVSYRVKPVGLRRSIVRAPTKWPQLSVRKTDISSSTIADTIGVLSGKTNALDVQDVSRGTDLHRAAWNGQEEAVSNLLNQKVDRHTADKYGQLPMHLAAERGHVNVVKALMTNSTDFGQRCIGDEQTVLHRAAWSGSLAVVRLLAAKPVLDLLDRTGQTALHIAAALSYLPLVSLLLQRGAKVNVKDKRGWSPMAWAARNGDEAIVKTFLQHSDIEINPTDELGRTPLHLASWYGHINVVYLLLNHPAIDRDVTDIFGRTPAFHAGLHGYLDLMQALSNHSRFGRVRLLDLPQASNSQAENKCHTVVDYLIRHQNPQKQSSALPGKGSPDRRDENSNILLWATSWGHYEIVEYLLHCGVYPDPKAESLHPGTKAEIYVRPESPLQLAARNGDDRLLKLLLGTGEVNINYWKDEAQPALFSAIRSYNQAAIGLFLEEDDVYLGYNDYSNSSAFTHAVNLGNIAILKQLLATGRADISFGESTNPLAIAALRGHEDMTRLLLSMPEIEVDTDEALLRAAKSGHAGVVRILLEAGKADINARERYRLITPLIGAAEGGHHAVVSLLLSTGKTDLSIQDKNGETALSSAGKVGHDRIVNLLLQHIQDVNVHNQKAAFEAVIFEAAWYGLAAVVKGLLEIAENVQLDPQDSCLRTPLIYGAMFGALDFVKALLSSGRNVDVNAQDECLRTPLSYAAERGHESVVAELLALGDRLDINLKDSAGYTPLCYATLLDRTRVANRLWSTGRADLGGVDLRSIHSPHVGQPPVRGSISLEPWF